jgi:hypothetical protein
VTEDEIGFRELEDRVINPLIVAAALALAAPAGARMLAGGIPLGVVVSTSDAPIAASTSAVIAEIRVQRVNVFDLSISSENVWPFRIADEIHVVTRDRVVRQEVLLSTGGAWDPLRAIESERNMRAMGFFRSADVTPVPRPDGQLDLDVRTQDSWTLQPEISLGTEGGQSYYGYGISDNNLLGLGKSISLIHTENGPLRSSNVTYTDPRFLGTRYQLTPYYTQSNYGDSVGTGVVKQFYALDVPQAMGVVWNTTINNDILYQATQDYSQFLETSRVESASYGLRLPEDSYAVQRVEAGWYDERDHFNAESDTVEGTLPADRELSGPTVGYSLVQPRYVKETDIDKMARVEDFNMGNELQLFGGWMGAATGSDRDRVIFNALDQQGLAVAPGRFFLVQAGTEGRLRDGVLENALLYANFNAFWKTDFLGPQTWVAHLEGNKGRSLDGENQVILGGNTGLRGYDNYAFTGDESVLLNLEDRLFFPGEYFHLVQFGGVAFFDSGAVTQQGQPLSWGRFNSDAGVGLRASSTRSQSGTVVRFDVAYALNQGPDSPRVVLSIAGSQAFQIFNSSTRYVHKSPASQLIPPQTAQ